MIDIQIDVTDLEKFQADFARAQMAGFPNGIHQLVKGMEVLRQDWIDYARNVLKNENYAQELEEIPVVHPYGGDELQAACVAGQIAHGVEFGTNAWDMKPGFLDGNAVHNGGPNGEECAFCGQTHITKRTSRWVNVPFRHGTPGSSGRLGAAMPKEIHKMAKRLAPYTTGGGGVFPGVHGGATGQRLNPPRVGSGKNAAEWGQRTQFTIPPGAMTMQHGMTSVNPQSKQGFATYTWKTGLYNDMVKVQRPRGKGVHTQYMTWRRVSNKSSAESWWYPAKAARPVRDIIIKRNEDQLQRRVLYGIAVDMGMVPETKGFRF